MRNLRGERDRERERKRVREKERGRETEKVDLKASAKIDVDCTEKKVWKIVAIWFVGVKKFLFHL